MNYIVRVRFAHTECAIEACCSSPALALTGGTAAAQTLTAFLSEGGRLRRQDIARVRAVRAGHSPGASD
jgi:hypothetical protein